MEQTQYIHIHDVMDIIRDAQRALTLSEIKALIEDNFGTAAQFASCSVQGMNSEGVVQFLCERGKLFESEPGKFTLASQHTCGH